jgi:rSAM/selenodomain-associated transferase 1
MNHLLLIFAKTPTRGQVKTRLAEHIGITKALWVYKQLIQKTAAETEKFRGCKVVFYTGSPMLSYSFFDDYTKKIQSGSDLGERMAAGFEWGFSQDFTKIVAIGADLWDLELELLENAFKLLESHEVVIGPANDGGYYLIGMNRMISQVFKEKKWGSDSVLSDTLDDLHAYRVGLLTEKNDIDDYQDLLNCKSLFSLYKTQFYESEN